jgi:hypothetical protein
MFEFTYFQLLNWFGIRWTYLEMSESHSNNPDSFLEFSQLLLDLDDTLETIIELNIYE